MFGEIGSTWGDNFCTGTQNGLKHEIWHEKILIHALEFKLQPFEVPPYVCIGSHAFAMFSAHAHISVTTFTIFWQMGRLLALYGSSMHPAIYRGFWTIFFPA